MEFQQSVSILVILDSPYKYSTISKNEFANIPMFQSLLFWILHINSMIQGAMELGGGVSILVILDSPYK